MQNRNGWRFFSGGTGRAYLYPELDLRDDSPLPFSGGNLIFAKDKGDDMDIVYIDESEDVRGEIAKRWSFAKVQYGADLIFCRPEADPLVRDAEKRDLMNQWSPPMNDS